MKARRNPAKDEANVPEEVDRFILEFTAALVRGSADGMPRMNDQWLARLADLLDVDRITLWELSPDGAAVLRRHTYNFRGHEAAPEVVPAVQFPWLMEQNRQGRIVVWRQLPEDTPPDAIREREYALLAGAKSLLSIPVFSHSALCVLAFTSLRAHHRWPQPLVDRVQLISTILAGAVVRDRLDASLRASEERFRGAFENSAIGMSIIGLDGRWLRANLANCRMLGYSEEELRTTEFRDITHPDDVAANADLYRRAVSGELDHYELEKRYFHKNGHLVHGLLTVSVVRDEAGTPLYFVSQLQDRTETLKAQSEIARLRAELSHFGRVAVMGQLTASLAHQLMQPITAMQANAEACQRLLAEHRPNLADARRGLQDIASSCTRATYIVENVKDLLRKEPGSRRHVSLNALLKEVLEVVRHDMVARHVKVVTRLDRSSPQLLANPIELQQVFLNLVLNAAEALEHHVSSREIVVGTRKRERSIEVYVQDTGPGVAEEDLKRIFQPFFTTKPGGMGMGLAICHDIVLAHGGAISAASDPKGGFRVSCSFPDPEK
jgi:PAS domain S-box-containing protein